MYGGLELMKDVLAKGIIRRECEKGNPSRLHKRGGVARGLEEVLSIPITATGEGKLVLV